VAITIPHGVAPTVRKRLANLGADGLTRLNGQIIKRARRNLLRGGWVRAYAVQRHYLTQRSPAITDARMDFKLETSQPRKTGQVKRQPEWAELFAKLLHRKRSNIQFGYVVHLPWGTKGLDSRESLRLIVENWQALKPLLDAVRVSSRRLRA